MAFRWNLASSLSLSIRTKILLVLVAVVVPAIVLYLVLAARVSFNDKTLLIYELNQSGVRTLGDSVESRLIRVIDKLKAIAKSPAQAQAWVSEDSEILRLKKFDSKSSQVVFTQGSPWTSYGLGSVQTREVLDAIEKTATPSFEPIFVSNVSLEKLPIERKIEGVPPVILISISNGTSGWAAFVRGESLLEGFQSGGVAEFSLMGSDGKVLAHSDQKAFFAHANLSEELLFKAASESKVRLEVKRFDEGGKTYLGSFYRLPVAGLVLTSKIKFEEAYVAARLLMKKSALYAIAIISAAFLIAFFFANSLTKPIDLLVEATRKVAGGDFSLRIQTTAGDELSLLAASFNSMTTDLKNSREKIEEYSKDLENKVTERTAKLEAQNIAIRDTQEALVRTTRLASVGEIAGRAAHEVLNPLTNITTRLEKIQVQSLKGGASDIALLKEIAEAWKKEWSQGGFEPLIASLKNPSQALPGKSMLEEDLGNIEAVSRDALKLNQALVADIDFLLKECSRITKIVNGMRSLTRVTGTKRAIPIHTLLDESFGSMGDLFSKNRIETDRGYCEGSPQVLFDRDELMQVVNNLLRNSMQSILGGDRTKQMLGKVWISTQVQSGVVKIRVSDNGPGIPSDIQGRIFEPTFTTKSLEEGTGLGLSICRRFIRAYEGEIVLEKSVPYQETAFLITLPEANESAVQDAANKGGAA